MIRVLLINPPSPERLGAPLLGQQYVVSALLAAGCEVRVIDAAARRFTHDADWIVAEVDRFKPDIVGFGLFTRWVYHAYQLAARIRGPLMVCGGAHVTVRPEEALLHGFDIAVTGEAEHTIVRLIQHIKGDLTLDAIPGIVYRDSHGVIRNTGSAGFIQDLDALAFPHDAQHLYDRRWYHDSNSDAVPGGVLASRGCPARCTFCANYVTGRSFRYRSAANVINELKTAHTRHGSTFFPFWDDALTANIPHLLELCDAFERRLNFPMHWTAITRANMVKPETLRRMRQAGCIMVNFGVESGDDSILSVIKKGVNTDHVVRALEWSKAEGLRTACNFMLGFPQETPAALENTLRFMKRIAPLVDTFSTLGVVVPFPGTPIYEDFHQQFGFTDWWLREDYSRYEEPPSPTDYARFHRHYIDDANLELDFFRYSPAMRSLIRECLRYKAEHNLHMMGYAA